MKRREARSNPGLLASYDTREYSEMMESGTPVKPRFCEETDKIAYTSPKAARHALTGQLRAKRIRVYPCPYHPSHFHITKEGTTKL